MGASMAISLRSQLRRSLSRKRLFLRVLQRSFLLVVLGVILNSNGNKKNSITNLRLPGVLQRIGLAYFVVAFLETVLMKPQGSFQVEKHIVVACNIREVILVFMTFKASKCMRC
jgi:predicted acyltransferase